MNVEDVSKIVVGLLVVVSFSFVAYNITAGLFAKPAKSNYEQCMEQDIDMTKRQQIDYCSNFEGGN